MPKKKDRVITLRISEDDFNAVEGFAKAKGLSVSAYINSVIKSQTEFFIPLASTKKVAIPKAETVAVALITLQILYGL